MTARKQIWGLYSNNYGADSTSGKEVTTTEQEEALLNIYGRFFHYNMCQTSYKGIMAQISGSNSFTRGQMPEAIGAMILQSEQRGLQIEYFNKMK